MSERQKSQRGFVAVTLITLLAIAMVIMVYAAFLATIPGGEVTVGGVTGQVTYSTDNVVPGTWTANLSLSGIGDDWYARLVTTGGEYEGPVAITWTLQRKGSFSNWTDATTVTTDTTNIILTSGSQTIYATGDGTGPTGNHDWSVEATTTGSYRVVVTIDSTG